MRLICKKYLLLAFVQASFHHKVNHNQTEYVEINNILFLRSIHFHLSNQIELNLVSSECIIINPQDNALNYTNKDHVPTVIYFHLITERWDQNVNVAPDIIIIKAMENVIYWILEVLILSELLTHDLKDLLKYNSKDTKRFLRNYEFDFRSMWKWNIWM